MSAEHMELEHWQTDHHLVITDTENRDAYMSIKTEDLMDDEDWNDGASRESPR